jgi:hypothetical protein
VGIKNATNGAKTTKIRLVEGARTNLQRTLKNLGLTEKDLLPREGIFVKFEKLRGFSAKNARACRFDRY